MSPNSLIRQDVCWKILWLGVKSFFWRDCWCTLYVGYTELIAFSSLTFFESKLDVSRVSFLLVAGDGFQLCILLVTRLVINWTHLFKKAFIFYSTRFWVNCEKNSSFALNLPGNLKCGSTSSSMIFQRNLTLDCSEQHKNEKRKIGMGSCFPENDQNWSGKGFNNV